MHKPLKITYRNIRHSATLDSLVQERERKLEHYCDRIKSCHVFVEGRTHAGSALADHLHVRIDLDVPGKRLRVVSDEPRGKRAGDAACAAIQHAFRDLQKQLRDYLCDSGNERAGRSPVTRRGRICELFPEMNYGKIAVTDGSEAYFHRNSVLDEAFDTLEVGTPVRFIEELGLLGPQAVTVKIAGTRRRKRRDRHAGH